MHNILLKWLGRLLMSLGALLLLATLLFIGGNFGYWLPQLLILSVSHSNAVLLTWVLFWYVALDP